LRGRRGGEKGMRSISIAPLFLLILGIGRFEMDCDAVRPNDGSVQSSVDDLAVAGLCLDVATYSERADHKLLYLQRRDARDRSGVGLATLQKGVRDTVAVAHALLAGVGRGHRIAPIVEELACEQRRDDKCRFDRSIAYRADFIPGDEGLGSLLKLHRAGDL
jgi:hypothetical protein